MIGLIMKPGDLVKIMRKNAWGGFEDGDTRGIIVKQIYQAYSPEDSEWEVYVEGKLKRIRGKNLIEIKSQSCKKMP